MTNLEISTAIRHKGRCGYCHDDEFFGIVRQCSECGAVYHNECCSFSCLVHGCDGWVSILKPCDRCEVVTRDLSGIKERLKKEHRERLEKIQADNALNLAIVGVVSLLMGAVFGCILSHGISS